MVTQKEIVLEGKDVSIKDLMRIMREYHQIRIYGTSERKVKILKLSLKERDIAYHEKKIAKGIIRIDTDKATIFVFKR